MKAMDIENSITLPLSASLRILVLEQFAEDSEIILQELQNAGMAIEPTVVADRAEFEAAVNAGGFAAVLSADRLAGWTGLEALQCLRRTGRDTPFLLVTSGLEEKAAAELVKQGFDDCVLKDRLTRLPVALKRALEEKHLRDANAKSFLRCGKAKPAIAIWWKIPSTAFSALRSTALFFRPIPHCCKSWPANRSMTCRASI